MRRPPLVSLASVATLLLATAAARADVSTWLALGGGATGQVTPGLSAPDTSAVFDWTVGVGTSPRAPIVVGGVYRGQIYPGFGTSLAADLGPALRIATGSFARGDWGVALDAGVVWRTWGPYGWFPLQGVLTAGLPWGFQVAVGGQAWNIGSGSPAEGMFVALEIDLLRLTVTRQGSTDRWWFNPNPAGGRAQAAGLSLPW